MSLEDDEKHGGGDFDGVKRSCRAARSSRGFAFEDVD